MNLVKAITCSLLICMVAITGCTKDDFQETGQSTSPNLSLRGGLAFNVKDGNGNAIAGATMSIALSQQELNSGTYLATHNTDASGHVDFGMLNSGNYYYRVDVTINNVAYHGEGVVQVQGGENLTQELTLQ